MTRQAKPYSLSSKANTPKAIGLSPSAQAVNAITKKLQFRDGVHVCRAVECASVFDLVSAAARAWRESTGKLASYFFLMPPTSLAITSLRPVAGR